MFSIVLVQILVMFAYMAMGFALTKAKLADPSHGKTLSAFLVYCCTPGMIIGSFQNLEYSEGSTAKLVHFFFASLMVQLLLFAVIALLVRKRLNEGSYRILTIASFMGNVGFFGQPILIAMYPNDSIVPCYSMMIALSMNMLIFTIGEFMVSRDRKYISLKRAVLNPTILSAFMALPLYFLQIRLPAHIQSTMLMLRSMSVPVCMLVLGIRLASMAPKKVFGNPFAYIISAIKLIAFPLFSYALVSFIPWFDKVFKIALLISCGTPCASVILSLAELHNSEQEESAVSILLSTIFCVVTLPLLAAIFA